MLDKLKPLLEVIFKYLTETSITRKILDVALISFLIMVIAIASGKVPLPTLPHYNSPNHTVENTQKQSKEVQKIIDVAQDKHSLAYIGYYRYHNGVQSLDGFNFMKWSLTEYSTAPNVIINALDEQAVPVVANPSMVGAHVDGRCYQSTPSANLPNYVATVRSGISSYTSCPVFSRQRQLSGYVYVGSTSLTPPAIEIVQDIAMKISIYGKDTK